MKVIHLINQAAPVELMKEIHLINQAAPVVQKDKEEPHQELQLELLHQVYHQACLVQIANLEDPDATAPSKINAQLDLQDQKELLDVLDLKDFLDFPESLERMLKMLRQKAKMLPDASTALLDHKDLLDLLVDLDHVDIPELKDKVVCPDVMETQDIQENPDPLDQLETWANLDLSVKKEEMRNTR